MGEMIRSRSNFLPHRKMSGDQLDMERAWIGKYYCRIIRQALTDPRFVIPQRTIHPERFSLSTYLYLRPFIQRSIPLIPGSLTLIENFATPSPSWDINIHRRAERRLTLHPLGITLIHPILYPAALRPPPRFYETVPTHHLSASVAEIVARLLSRCRDLILTDPDTWDKFCFQNQKRVRRLSATAVRRIVTSHLSAWERYPPDAGA